MSLNVHSIYKGSPAYTVGTTPLLPRVLERLGMGSLLRISDRPPDCGRTVQCLLERDTCRFQDLSPRSKSFRSLLINGFELLADVLAAAAKAVSGDDRRVMVIDCNPALEANSS